MVLTNVTERRSQLAEERAYRITFKVFSETVQSIQSLTTRAKLDLAVFDAAFLNLENARLQYGESRDALVRRMLRMLNGDIDLDSILSARNTHEDRVKQIAETLWELAGRPDGTADQDWYRAEEIVRRTGRMGAL